MNRGGKYLLIVLSLSLTGCPFDLVTGHYEGAFFTRVGEEIKQEPVKLKVSRRADTILDIEVKNINNAHLTNLSIIKEKKHELMINAPFLSSIPIFLKSRKRKALKRNVKCYVSYDSTSIEFCFKKDQFQLLAFDYHHVPFIQLSANSFKEEEPVEQEPQVTLTLTGAIDFAFEHNFDSLIAYEHVTQAREAANSAYANLVPHLTSNLIWNAAPNYVTFLATLQGLAPFLLPSYWLQAKQAQTNIKIQETALTIMRANLASMVEELSYAYARDTDIYTTLETLLEKAETFQLKALSFNLPSPAQEKLIEFSKFLIAALNSDLGDIEKLIEQDRFSLAEALGFYNIEAVKHVRIDFESLKIENARVIRSPTSEAENATERSFELKQLDELKRIAELKKIENLFIWIDPSGDPKQGLGLNTFPQQKQAASQIEEIKLQRKQMKTHIHQTVRKLILRYNESIRAYHEVTQSVSENGLELDRILANAKAGKPIRLMKLKEDAHRAIASQIAPHITLANFRTARAKKDRYFLVGYYLHLQSLLLSPGLVDMSTNN